MNSLESTLNARRDTFSSSLHGIFVVVVFMIRVSHFFEVRGLAALQRFCEEINNEKIHTKKKISGGGGSRR